MTKPAQSNKNIVLSVVIPLHNEAENIPHLVEKLCAILPPLNLPFELIFVDDGSTDKTWQAIKTQQQKHTQIKALKFSRNFGHQNAVMAGLNATSGQAIITMDGDLQHPPEAIPTLVEHWQRGYLVVTTSRKEYHTTWLKKCCSKWFSSFFSYISKTKLSFDLSDFRLFDRKVLNAFKHFNDSQLFLRGIVNWLGYSNINVPISFHQRHSGKSKFNFLKLAHYATRAIISFSTKPLLLAIWLGLLSSAFAFFQFIDIIIQYYLGLTPPGWATIVAMTTLLFGILFITLGIIGAYVASIHEMLQNRPRYIISEESNPNAVPDK